MNSNASSQENTTYEDVIDLSELFSVLWKAKLIITIITSFFALSSVLYALSLTNFYKSEAILSVAGESNTVSPLSGVSGLASMAGITLPSSGESKSETAIKTIQSRAFLKHLITFENVLPSLMAAKSYDFESKKIQFDPENLQSTKISADIDISKTAVSDTLYTETLKTSDWFNSNTYPTARYVSKRIEQIAAGKYLITGDLTIKDITKTVKTTVNISINGNQATARGQTNIKRTEFQIGNSSDPTGDWVSIDIPVALYIVAIQQ